VETDSDSPFGAFGIYEKAGFTPKLRFVSWALEI
jgi:mycothiol synthase